MNFVCLFTETITYLHNTLPHSYQLKEELEDSSSDDFFLLISDMQYSIIDMSIAFQNNLTYFLISNWQISSLLKSLTSVHMQNRDFLYSGTFM
jgi:hypothetical protein